MDLDLQFYADYSENFQRFQDTKNWNEMENEEYFWPNSLKIPISTKYIDSEKYQEGESRKRKCYGDDETVKKMKQALTSNGLTQKSDKHIQNSEYDIE